MDILQEVLTRGREGFLPKGLAAEAFSMAVQELRRQISWENISLKLRFCSIFVQVDF